MQTLRFEKNMTQGDLATRSGITRQQISRIESKGHVPSIETIRKLSWGLGVASAEFAILYDRFMREEAKSHDFKEWLLTGENGVEYDSMDKKQ